MTARTQILDSLSAVADRSSAVGSPASPSRRENTDRPTEAQSADALLASFLDRCVRARATTSSVDEEAAIPGAVAEFLAAQNIEAIVVVEDALKDLDWSNLTLAEPTMEQFIGDGLTIVTKAQFGVTETGSVVALSGPDSDSRLNFLAETHVAVLSESAVVATAEEVWSRLKGGGEAHAMPRSVNFITGPSRTADIEQTIELGAHGPRRLHIILLRG